MCHGPLFASLYLREELARDLLEEVEDSTGRRAPDEDPEDRATEPPADGTPSFLSEGVEDDLQILTGGARE